MPTELQRAKTNESQNMNVKMPNKLKKPSKINLKSLEDIAIKTPWCLLERLHYLFCRLIYHFSMTRSFIFIHLALFS